MKTMGESSQLSREDCESGIETCLNLVDDLIPMSELSQEVFAAAIANNMTAYDMYYAVTTSRYNGRILTIDKKLKESAIKMMLRILDDWPLSPAPYCSLRCCSILLG
jgi:predicted nucleic acid-binding protein